MVEVASFRIGASQQGDLALKGKPVSLFTTAYVAQDNPTYCTGSLRSYLVGMQRQALSRSVLAPWIVIEALIQQDPSSTLGVTKSSSFDPLLANVFAQ